MSERELSRLRVIEDVETQRLSVVQAAELAGVSRRQMTRLLRSYGTYGAAGLISKKRGKSSNRKYSNGFRDYVLELIRLHYADFGPTLALEKLSENHDISVQQAAREVSRSQKAPRRTGQTDHMF